MDYKEKFRQVWCEKREKAENKILDLESKREYLLEEYVEKRIKQLRKWILFYNDKLAELD